MSSISQFKANLIQGGARANQFQVFVTFPSLIPNGQVAGQRAQFMAKAAQLPASTIAEVPISFRGRTVYFAGEREFQPWTITVYNDNDFQVRNAFEAWVDTIQNSNSTSGALNPALYQVDLQVNQLDRNERVVKTYNFKDAFPLEVGAIQLDWDQNNQIETFDVTFRYNYFESVGAQGVRVG